MTTLIQFLKKPLSYLLFLKKRSLTFSQEMKIQLCSRIKEGKNSEYFLRKYIEYLLGMEFRFFFLTKVLIAEFPWLVCGLASFINSGTLVCKSWFVIQYIVGMQPILIYSIKQAGPPMTFTSPFVALPIPPPNLHCKITKFWQLDWGLCFQVLGGCENGHGNILFLDDS